jgi:uncharacterized protein with LGFP repeats
MVCTTSMLCFWSMAGLVTAAALRVFWTCTVAMTPVAGVLRPYADTLCGAIPARNAENGQNVLQVEEESRN